MGQSIIFETKRTDLAANTKQTDEQTELDKSSSLLDKIDVLFQIYFRKAFQNDAGRKDREFRLFTGLPLKPYNERETIRTELVPGRVWGFEQEQGFFNVSVNTRMTAIKLESGGLWVHAPVAPTIECMELLNSLGPVEHIVLPTTALEHKIFVGPFSKNYPDAKVWVAPDQWSWPINLPLNFKVDGFLESDKTFPWSNEIEYELFQPPILGLGPANEVAFFHKATKSLLLTDLLISIPKDPPAIIPDAALAESSVEEGEEPPSVIDQEVRRTGWSKMALQILFFGPANPNTFNVVSEIPLVAPVSRTLVLERIPDSVVDWINRITKWDIQQVIPCHFSAPVKANSQDIKDAYSFAYKLVEPSSEDIMSSTNEEQSPVNPFEQFFKKLTGSGENNVQRKLKDPIMFSEQDMERINSVRNQL